MQPRGSERFSSAATLVRSAMDLARDLLHQQPQQCASGNRSSSHLLPRGCLLCTAPPDTPEDLHHRPRS
eukprot:1929553-Pyramimonas_sp.AAC.1